MTRWVITCSVAALFVVALGACQGRRLLTGTPQAGRTAATHATPAVAPGAGGRGRVTLSDADLAPVDAYIHTRNSQWIVGDRIEVHASKEYFSQVLTLNEKVGLVHRKDRVVGGDTLVTMTYVGYAPSASAQTNPRVMIGTGITATARKTLTVRLVKTANPGVPVQLRILAQGKAARGRKDKVTERNETLQIGGALRWTGRNWHWATLNR